MESQGWRLKDFERFHSFSHGIFCNFKDGVSKILQDSIAFSVDSCGISRMGPLRSLMD